MMIVAWENEIVWNIHFENSHMYYDGFSSYCKYSQRWKISYCTSLNYFPY